MCIRTHIRTYGSPLTSLPRIWTRPQLPIPTSFNVICTCPSNDCPLYWTSELLLFFPSNSDTRPNPTLTETSDSPYHQPKRQPRPPSSPQVYFQLAKVLPDARPHPHPHVGQLGSTTVNQASRKDRRSSYPTNYLTLPNRIHTAALSLMQTPAPSDLAFSRYRYFTLVRVRYPVSKYLKPSSQLPTHGATGNRPPVSDSSSQSASASSSITAHWHWWGKLLAAAIAQ
ncbi:hypothetical protein CCUS01_16466 [Colletotrichum cuscutae]|uniref:Uncharacterized protein n=1 Tax=Colletotrichum cuscutae TaxID=1209917 RepID=A0AAI9Y3P5_9PEZI|nr:hypothetical protein CCUS01_16466 [Colletotrichum cuscutae]